MASIRKEVQVNARPEKIWDAVRDVGTFGNGQMAHELIVDIDDEARRLAWAVVGTRLTHHNASMQIFPEGEGRSRVVWIADLLPNELAGYIRTMIEQSLGVMKQTMERG